MGIDQINLIVIAKCVSYSTGITLQELRGKKRRREIVDARKMLAVVARKERFSFIRIGRFLRRDHSSVIYYTRSHNDLMATNKGYATSYERMYNCLYEKDRFDRAEIRGWLERYLHRTHRKLDLVMEEIILECILSFNNRET